jgi:CheY-like chemotaxis protein
MFHFSIGPSARRWRCPTSLILVVDDNRDAANMLALLLRRWEYRVLVAYDGVAALELIEADWPTLAILDINMPLMSGVELARRLRRRAQGRRLPLYALTVIDSSVDAESSNVFNSCLLKPADPELLHKRLKRDCSMTAGDSILN